MKSFIQYNERNKILFFVFLLGSAFIFYLTRNYIDSADLIQYLSLSEQYAKLPLAEAANDFWSPLISWLIIPINPIFKSHLIAFKVVQFLLSLNLFLLVLSLSEKIKMTDSIKVLFFISIGLVIIPFGAFNGSPDLLYLNILLFIVLTFSRNDFSLSSGIMMGFAGALLFLSKSFGILFYPCFLSLHFIFNKKKNHSVLNFYLPALFIFITISSVWGLTLSNKNRTLTVSGASKYNFSLMNPKINPNLTGQIKHPIDRAHYLPPAGKYAVSAWQNPNGFNLPKWAPKDGFLHYGKVVSRNLLSLVYYYFSYLMLILLAFYLSLIYLKRKNNFSLKLRIKEILSGLTTRPFSILLSAAIITTFLYSLILTQKRYLWINEICILFLVLYLVQPLSNRLVSIILSITILLSLINFYKELNQVLHSKLNTEWNSDPILILLKQSNNQLKIISDEKEFVEGYTVNSALCFLGGAKNYGVLPLDSLKVNKFEGLFLTRGNHTIKSEDNPLIEFMIYSPLLDYSLYKVIPQ